VCVCVCVCIKLCLIGHFFSEMDFSLTSIAGFARLSLTFSIFLFLYRSFHFQDFKECIDAEGLMPHNTSDMHKTICMEMRMAKAMNILSLCHGGTKSSSFVTPLEQIGPNKFSYPSIDAAGRSSLPSQSSSREPTKQSSINSKLSSAAAVSPAPAAASTASNGSTNLISNQNYNIYNSNNADLASVDSSDTFMSCQTHPFLSQGDLTSPVVDDDERNVCSLDMLDADNLYMNTLNKNSSGTLTRGSSLYSGGVNIVDIPSSAQGSVKKSTSGDTALRSLGASPIDDFAERGSRVSLNETPVPKHRKTRFQQQQHQMLLQQQQHQQQSNNLNKSKSRFDGNGSGKAAAADEEVAPTTTNKTKNRRASFMPSKIITTATKQLINQHLFGIQSMSKGE